jgi:hypothetical protein
MPLRQLVHTPGFTILENSMKCALVIDRDTVIIKKDHDRDGDRDRDKTIIDRR